MHLLRVVSVASVVLLIAGGCVHVGSGSGSPPPPPAPPPPPGPTTMTGPPCGWADKNAPGEVVIMVNDNATIAADKQYVFLEIKNQMITWRVTPATGKKLIISFYDESAFRRPPGLQSDSRTTILRQGGGNCEAFKYTITVERVGQTPAIVDPILIIRE